MSVRVCRRPSPCTPQFPPLNLPPRPLLPLSTASQSASIYLTSSTTSHPAHHRLPESNFHTFGSNTSNSNVSSTVSTPTTIDGGSESEGLEGEGDIRGKAFGGTATSFDFPKVDPSKAMALSSEAEYPPTYFLDGPTKIIENLYLGSYGDAQNRKSLERLQVRWVLNAANECTDTEALELGISVLSLPLEDHSDQPIADHFDRALDFIFEGLQRKEAVLVHCRMGVSRSVAIIIAFLMRYGITPNPTQQPMSQSCEFLLSGRNSDSRKLLDCQASCRGLSYNDAFDWVKCRRPQASPNLGFILTLRAMENPDFQATEWSPSTSSSQQSPLFVQCPPEDARTTRLGRVGGWSFGSGWEAAQ